MIMFLAAKNCQKSGKRGKNSGKLEKRIAKKRTHREGKPKIRKALSLCPESAGYATAHSTINKPLILIVSHS